jgi:hypothetical protein
MAKRRSMKRKSMKTMKKRRMSKMRHAKKMIRKSRRMRGGGITDYLPSFLTGKKPQQQNYDMTTESNSGFGSQQRVGPQPIKQYTEEEYTQFREKPNIGDKPVAEITMNEKSSWW